MPLSQPGQDLAGGLPGALVQDLGLVDYWRASGEWSEFCRDDGQGGVICR